MSETLKVDTGTGRRQVIRAESASGPLSFALPSEHTEVMPGVPWGRCDVLFTPAYWRAQAWLCDVEGVPADDYAIGATFREEVAACLLGGHGVPAEIAVGAFEGVRSSGLLRGTPPTPDQCYSVLMQPVTVRGRRLQYRFARQKSIYLSLALNAVNNAQPPIHSDAAFRDWLTRIPGIGPKTASWITRNWLHSDSVAIIDVHVHRAGCLAGFFAPDDSIARHYSVMERTFLAFAESIEVSPRLLDTLIWRDMRHAGTIARTLMRHLNHDRAGRSPRQ